LARFLFTPLDTIVYIYKFMDIDEHKYLECTPMQFGRMQLRIMHVLWEQGRANAREITEALNRSQPVAHSTVQTLLRQLEAKGAVGHRALGRTFVFFPKLKQDRAQRTAVRNLVERVFGGDVGGLVAHLLHHEKMSPDELSKLRRLIDEERRRDMSKRPTGPGKGEEP
jgi:BlaI family penicillinase repressor